MSNEMDRFLLEATLYAMAGESPSKAIEDQERRGQQSVVRNQRLPKYLNNNAVPLDILNKGVSRSMSYEKQYATERKNNKEYTLQQYNKMGITIVGDADDLFYDVQLPEGWEIKATDHHMWNDLFDNKGRKRASFFYKAAFYDKDAFINFETRYHISVNHVANPDSDYEIYTISDYQGTVKDGEETIYETESVPVTGDYSKNVMIKKKLRKQLEEFMIEYYPDYENIHAYWED